jgi:glycosyltransferase involved in cell wall biosynthesis
MMPPLITIAIPDLSGIIARNNTLQSIARHTPEPHEVVLLVEELQGQRVVPLRSDDQALRRISVPAPFSTPIALNRLLTTSTTPYILLLESGSIVTSDWLARLLAPLADATVGLSGPSTNASWNEQKVLIGSEGVGWSVQQIDTYAASVAIQYSNQWKSLDTLHSLGDFCYLFKRSVAEQLGGFDEAYGAGPCWEIDFNTRAARADFRAVWVADAYIHRGPQSPWKVASIRRHFTASKQLYQDRFCGLRLQGKKTDYEPHCRGEACEHFAPSDLIQITLRQGWKNEKTSQEALLPLAEPKITPGPSHPATILNTSASTQEDLPLVSCIMPTRNRKTFVQQALLYFERQDYPNRELIIVDDGTESVADLVSSNPHVRYISLPQHTSIGAKRNLACEMAKGAIIAHWDDDDWYAPHRLRHQVAPLLAKTADITGLETSCFFDLTRWQAWTCTPALHSRLFMGDVHGGTLVYWRNVWERLARYPSASLAEDALFLRDARRRGARLQKLPHANSFVYLRHHNNAWSFPLGSYLDSKGWKQTDLNDYLPADDLPFYGTLSPAAPALPSPGPLIEQPDTDKEKITRQDDADRSPGVSLVTAVDQKPPSPSHQSPLVSCIMPTYNRRAYVPQAIQYFLRQDYPDRELLILDDGSEPINDLVPSDPRIRYVRLEKRMILGAKRNFACKLAQGQFIAHWDDDDWIAPHRLRYQVEMLEQQKKDVCGTGRLLFYSPVAGKSWLYEYPPAMRCWLAGGTLCYRKDFWLHNPFPEIAKGEDTRFIWNFRAVDALVVPDYSFYVALVHAANTSAKVVSGPYWHPHPVEEIHRLLGPDLVFYKLAVPY